MKNFKKSRKIENLQFDESIKRKLFDLLNRWNFWYEDKKYIDVCSFLCASAERLESSAIYFNKQDKLDSDDKVILFMNHASIVVEVVNQSLKKFGFKIAQTNYFQDTYEKSLVYQENCPSVTDDEFFLYLRSLFFAHPNETSRAKFLKANKEIHYSPWPIPEHDMINELTGENDYIGIRIYSNLTPEILNLRFSKVVILKYVKSKLEQFNNVIKYVESKNAEFEKILSSRKIEVTGDLVNDLTAIKKELQLRYEDVSEIDDLIDYCTISVHKELNYKSLSLYKDDVFKEVPYMIRDLNNLDKESFDNRLYKFLSPGNRNYYEHENYHLEKIYCYLRDDESPHNVKWGLKQLELFMKQYARDYVDIDKENMSFTEIKALVTIARYLYTKGEK